LRIGSLCLARFVETTSAVESMIIVGMAAYKLEVISATLTWPCSALCSDDLREGRLKFCNILGNDTLSGDLNVSAINNSQSHFQGDTYEFSRDASPTSTSFRNFDSR